MSSDGEWKGLIATGLKELSHGFSVHVPEER